MDFDVGGGHEGELKGDLEVDLEGDFRGDFRGDFKPDLEGDLLSSSGQVQVWFSIELKFNSFERDSEVGRLVIFLSSLLQKARTTLHTLQFDKPGEHDSETI